MEKISSETIIAIINDTVEGINVSLDDVDKDLLEIGIDSLQFIHLIVVFEEMFKCEIPDSKLIFGEMNSIGKIKIAINDLADKMHR